MRRLAKWGLCIVALTAPAGTHAQSVADFYKGKTITVIVGYTAGGGYDLYARALARHMGKHLPGNPSFIVQNITGAGSLNAANNLYNVAPKDGTSFGTFGRGLAMEPLIGTARVQFDATKFTWLGSGTNEISLCATWHTSPVKTWQDALKTGLHGRRRRRRLRSRHLCRVRAQRVRRQAEARHRLSRHLRHHPGDRARRGRRPLRLVVVERQVDAAVLDSGEEAELPRPHVGSEGAGAAAHSRRSGDFANDRQKQILRLVTQPPDHGPAVCRAARRARRPCAGAAPRLRRGAEGSGVPGGGRQAQARGQSGDAARTSTAWSRISTPRPRTSSKRRASRSSREARHYSR